MIWSNDINVIQNNIVLCNDMNKFYPFVINSKTQLLTFVTRQNPIKSMLFAIYTYFFQISLKFKRACVDILNSKR